jgi:hypothetical protein
LGWAGGHTIQDNHSTSAANAVPATISPLRPNSSTRGKPRRGRGTSDLYDPALPARGIQKIVSACQRPNPKKEKSKLGGRVVWCLSADHGQPDCGGTCPFLLQTAQNSFCLAGTAAKLCRHGHPRHRSSARRCDPDWAPYWALIAIFTASQRACAPLASFASGRHWPFYLSTRSEAPTSAT